MDDNLNDLRLCVRCARLYLESIGPPQGDNSIETDNPNQDSSDVTHWTERAPRRAALIVNTRSRRGLEWFSSAKETLIREGIDLVEARAVKRPSDISAIVKAQINQDIPLVIVGGGDGTFGLIAHLFARKQTVLGVLPLGTGNAFARDLGIAPNVAAACSTILTGKVAHIDMGLIGDREFLNIATIGLTTEIVLGLQDDMKKRIGRVVYLGSILRALIGIKPFRVVLELPEGTFNFECLQLVIGNGRFHAGPFLIAPDASISGGWLSIYALASRRKGDFLKMALRMRSGTQADLKEVKAFRAQSGILLASPAQRITVDGETKLLTPVRFGIMPKALRVLVPETFSE